MLTQDFVEFLIEFSVKTANAKFVRQLKNLFGALKCNLINN